MKTHVSFGGVIAVACAAMIAPQLSAESAQPGVQATFLELTSPEVQPYRDTGRRAIDRIAVTMLSEASAVTRDGPVAAMKLCHLKGIPMTGGTVGGMPRIMAMKLTSLKVRNPANAPDQAEQLALAKVQADIDAGNPPDLLVQKIESSGAPPEWRVYKTVPVMKQCLTCHGQPDDEAPELRAALKERYPNDQANGYNVGEWRGLIRVTVAAPPTPVPSAPKSLPAKSAPARRG